MCPCVRAPSVFLLSVVLPCRWGRVWSVLRVPGGCGASGRLSASPARHPGLRLAVVGRRSARVLGPLFPLGRVVTPGARSLGVPVLPGNGDPDGWMGGRWRVRAVRCVRVLATSRGGAPAAGLSGARGRRRGGSPEAGSGVPGRRGTALACGGGIPCPFPWRARLSWPGVLPLRPLPRASGASPSVGGPGAAPTPPRCRCGLGCPLPPPGEGGLFEGFPLACVPAGALWGWGLSVTDGGGGGRWLSPREDTCRVDVAEARRPLVGRVGCRLPIPRDRPCPWGALAVRSRVRWWGCVLWRATGPAGRVARPLPSAPSSRGWPWPSPVALCRAFLRLPGGPGPSLWLSFSSASRPGSP